MTRTVSRIAVVAILVVIAAFLGWRWMHRAPGSAPTASLSVSETTAEKPAAIATPGTIRSRPTAMQSAAPAAATVTPPRSISFKGQGTGNTIAMRYETEFDHRALFEQLMT